METDDDEPDRKKSRLGERQRERERAFGNDEDGMPYGGGGDDGGVFALFFSS